MRKGTKYDSEKILYNLLDFKFIDGIVRILTMGAKKYAPKNWMLVEDAEERYKAALMRHTSSYLQGEDLDPESGETHLYHMGCCIMFLDYFRRQRCHEQDTQQENKDKR